VCFVVDSGTMADIVKEGYAKVRSKTLGVSSSKMSNNYTLFLFQDSCMQWDCLELEMLICVTIFLLWILADVFSRQCKSCQTRFCCFNLILFALICYISQTLLQSSALSYTGSSSLIIRDGCIWMPQSRSTVIAVPTVFLEFHREK